MITRRPARLAWAALAFLIWNPAASHADCDQLVDRFNQMIENGSEQKAKAIADEVAVDAQCGRLQLQVQRRLAAFRLQAAQVLMARGRPVGDYDRLLTDADRPDVLWQAAATLGDVRFGERRFVESALAFDRAIEIVKNDALTPTAPSKFEIASLFERAGQARILAANLEAGQETGGFVQTARDQRDGKLGGLYTPSLRGITLLVVPVPVTFDYAKTTFTPVGEKAAQELVTAIKEQRPSKITLIGHTDVRGSAEANMNLSVERANAVADVLRQNGIDTQIETIGKGATEPMKLSDTSGLSQDDIYALNRRVEWRRAE